MAPSREEMTEPNQRMRQAAHDIRTPLSVISMGLEALKQIDPNKSDDYFAMIEIIEKEGVGPLKEMVTRMDESDSV